MAKRDMNINTPNRDTRKSRLIVYLFCVLIMLACFFLDVYFIVGIFGLLT